MAGIFLSSRRYCSYFSSYFPVFFNLFFLSCQQPFVDSALPFVVVTSHILPVRNFQGYQVAFSNIPKTEQWTTYCTSANGEPAVHEVLRSGSIFYSRDVAQPTQSSSPQDFWQCCETCASQHLFVGDLVCPRNSQDTAKAAKMEAV